MKTALMLLSAWLLASGQASSSPAPSSALELVSSSDSRQCDGTQCEAGCCPEAGWFCCADDQFCAQTEEDCPPATDSSVAVFVKAVAVAVGRQCDPDETYCAAAGGCCPEPGWVCCTGDASEYCASTAASCPRRRRRTRQCDDDGVVCEGGCCDDETYVCCEDNPVWCAQDQDSCPEPQKE